MTMKTIKQIADSLGVSKQAVQKRIARDPLYTRLSPCIQTKNGVKYIDETGENLIGIAFNKAAPITMSIDVADNQIHSVYSEIVSLLREDIATLKEQLAIKDHQIQELTVTVRTQAESINADRRNELASTIIDGQKMLDASTPVSPVPAQGFFGRLFGRKKPAPVNGE